MSTPRFLSLPPGVRRKDIETPNGVFAVLEALPVTGVAERWPALLVPGFTGSKEDFIAILQTLAGAGRRVIAIDLRGQFETPGPDTPSAYTCEALGGDVAGIVRTLGDEPVHLVGHSFGGLVTRSALLDGCDGIASYTIMGSGPGALGGERGNRCRRLVDRLPSIGLDGLWQSSFEPDAIAAEVSEEILAFLRKRLMSSPPGALMGMAQALLSSEDKVSELAALGLSTLVLHGERDDAWPPSVQAEMAVRLRASRVVVAGAGHSPAVDAPETTARALTDFWNASERRSLGM